MGAGVGGGTLLKILIKMNRDKAGEGLEIISNQTPTAQDYGAESHSEFNSLQRKV